jgi:hypothetical protein
MPKETLNPSMELEPRESSVLLGIQSFQMNIANSHRELGTYIHEGSIKLGYKEESSLLLDNLRKEIGKDLPQAVSLNKNSAGIAISTKNAGTIFIGQIQSLYYLPQTNEYLTLPDDMGNFPSAFYPESLDFMGIDKLRNTFVFGVCISKVGDRPENMLSLEDVKKVLNQSEKYLEDVDE